MIFPYLLGWQHKCISYQQHLNLIWSYFIRIIKALVLHWIITIVCTSLWIDINSFQSMLWITCVCVYFLMRCFSDSCLTKIFPICMIMKYHFIHHGCLALRIVCIIIEHVPIITFCYVFWNSNKVLEKLASDSESKKSSQLQSFVYTFRILLFWNLKTLINSPH